MFKRTIGKRCESDGCGLKDQLQDAALVICPECGSDLALVQVNDSRGPIVVALALALLGGVGGFVVYGYVARALGPWQMLQLVLQNIEIRDVLQPAGAGDLVEARARFYNGNGPLPGVKGEFLIATTNGQRTATLRDHLDANTLVSFDVRPVAPDVSTLYFLHTDDRQAQVLFPADQAGGSPASGTISIPGRDASGKESGIELTGGAAIEHFVLIAAKKPLPSLDALRGKAAGQPIAAAEVNTAVANLERDGDAYVLHVYVPHS